MASVKNVVIDMRQKTICLVEKPLRSLFQKIFHVALPLKKHLACGVFVSHLKSPHLSFIFKPILKWFEQLCL